MLRPAFRQHRPTWGDPR